MHIGTRIFLKCENACFHLVCHTVSSQQGVALYEAFQGPGVA